MVGGTFAQLSKSDTGGDVPADLYRYGSEHSGTYRDVVFSFASPSSLGAIIVSHNYHEI